MINKVQHTTNLSSSARFVRFLLDTRPELTYAQLEELTGYDERTIRRAINELQELGIVIAATGRPRRFSLSQELRRNNHRIVALNEEEILALRLAAQVARSVFAPTPIANQLASAFKRLLAEVDEQGISIDQEVQGKQWHFGDAPSSPINSETFNQLRQVIRNEEHVKIDYYAARSETFWSKRRVTPLCIAASGGTWLLIAWCYERRDIRDFNLVDVSKVYQWVPTEKEVDELKLAAEIPFNPELYFRDRFRLLGGEVVYEVRLLVEPHQARYFKRKLYHPTQQIEEERKDSRIVVSYEVEGLEELRSFTQSWGTGITVLEPKELRVMLEKQAEEVLERYRGSKSNHQE